jgi:RHS repeat-associated protein
MPTQQSGRRISAPTLQTPEGGGAVRGLAESFEPQAFTGAGTLTIPIPAKAVRGLAPDLGLGYSSGGGNGPFGVGFTLSLPSVARKTSNGIPRYQGSDIFVHSAEGDLVPALAWDHQTASWVPDARAEPPADPAWDVVGFRPRRESSFSRIEQWTSRLDGTSHWRVLTSDNTACLYGVTADARIADPDHAERIFQWLPQELTDSRGNKIRYFYKPEDDVNVPAAIWERGRDHRANRYLSRVEYGNYVLDGTERFACRVVFDYGEYSITDPDRPAGEWAARPDPFSTYRSGFEIRTMRRCQALLVYHCLADQFNGQPFLVRALKLEYDQVQHMSFVRRVTETGYRKLADGSYRTAALPPVEFGYSAFEPSDQSYRTLTVEGTGSLPSYLGAGQYLMVDLEGQGLPGILYSDDASTLFWEPAGEGRYIGPVSPPGFPAESDLRGAELMLTSLQANGRREIVVTEQSRSGYYRCDGVGRWEPFRPFPAIPADLSNPATEMVDMTGSGRLDVALLDSEAITTWPSLGLDGYGPPEQAPCRHDFPARAILGGLELLTFADMFGDGLSHRVRIRDGEVECWPSLGYGEFGAKVRLGDAPRFPGVFDPTRLCLADLDGSGPVDLLYVLPDSVQVYLSRNGNGFSPPSSIPLPVPFDDISQVSFGDVYGNGTSCLILTQLSPLPVHYVYDFAGDAKPYLLTSVANQMGSATKISYISSVKQCLDDRRSGRPWATRLYFPVQVIDRIERTDETTRTRYVTRYRHHDGYYDPQYREFRGFGFVETWDTEEYADFLSASAGGAVRHIEADDWMPPVYTKTWYHTGALLESGVISLQYASEYWAADPDAFELPESSFGPAPADGETLRQAYAALAGTVLRQETYGLDGTAAAANPYLVEEACYQVRLVQPRQSQRFAVFLAYARQTIASHYDREPADPRVEHGFALDVDEFGNVKRSCQVAYPRREVAGHPSHPEQRQMLVTVAESSYINHVETDAEPYRWIGVGVESSKYEAEGLSRPPGQFSYAQINAEVTAALEHQVAFGRPFTPGTPQARLYSWTRSYYWDETRGAELPLGRISSHGLIHHGETAIAPPQLVADLFQGKGDPVELMRGRGYWLKDGYWWNRGLIQRYLPAPFFLPSQVDGAFTGVDPAGSLNPTTTLAYDKYHMLLVEVTRQIHGASALRVLGDNDYHVFLPWRVTDPNDNVTEVGFDPLGVVEVSTFYGIKEGVPVGNDPLTNYVTLPDPTFESVIADPARYVQNASSFFFYDLFAWIDRRQPPSAVGLRRQSYVHEQPPRPQVAPQIGISYSDGFGRIIENRLNTEPGQDGRARWAVSGQVTYNNKALIVRQYLPRFSPVPDYDPDWQPGPLPPTISRYDPLGRLVRIDKPKGFCTRTTYSPWMVAAYDEDDTVVESPFYRQFPADPATPAERAERAALDAAASFCNTPAIAILDPSGRTVRTLSNNLGGVTTATLEPITEGSGTTPQELWDDLVGYGYLLVDGTEVGLAWVSDTVRPYDHDFQTRLAGQFGDLAAPLANLLKENGLTTLHVLDVAGNVVTQIDPRLLYSNVVSGTGYRNVTAAFDMIGSALVAHSADAGSRWSLSDVFGNQVLTWDGREVLSTRRFDRLGRLTSVGVSDAGGSPLTTEVIVYGETQPDPAQRNLNGQVYQHYDPAGLVIAASYTITSQLAVSIRQVRADYDQEANWTLDAMAAVARQPAYQTSSRYDALDHLVGQTAPDGSESALSYNVGGQLVRTTVSGQGPETAVIDGIEYDATGLRTEIRYGNGTATSYRYEDTTLRLLTITTTGPAPGGQRVLQDIGYTFDPVGNVTHVENRSYQAAFCYEQPVSAGSDYGYDALYRLLRGTGRQAPSGDAVMRFCPPEPERRDLAPYIQQFGYDDGGNLITVESVTPSLPTVRFDIAPGSNRLATEPYDANGNMLAIGGLPRLDWSFGNALARAELADNKGEYFYLYDGGGSRVLKVERLAGAENEPSATTETIYVGDYQFIQAGSSQTERLSVMDGTTRVCLIEHAAGAWSLRYQLADSLGSVCWEVDAGGQPVSYQEYFPYGRSAFVAGAAGAAAREEYRFCGKELDQHAGLYYYGARYYCPAYGRWLSPDPAGTATGLNMYAFVEGNPISKVDTDGGVWFWIIWGTWAIGAFITLFVGVAGGLGLAYGVGTAAGIFMGTLAGLSGETVGSAIAFLGGEATPAIATAATRSVLSAVGGAYLGGRAGQRAMQRSSGLTQRPAVRATIGVLSSGIVGVLVGGGVQLMLSESFSSEALVSIVTGAGSAVLSSGAILGLRTRGNIQINPVMLTGRQGIYRARPLVNNLPVGGLPADRLLLVMAPQEEAERRYANSFQGHELDAYRLLAPIGQVTPPALYNVVAVHGSQGYVFVSTGPAGNIMRPMSIYGFAKFVRRELKLLGPNRYPGAIKFISCYGASWNIIASNAQVLADVTGREVYAFKGPHAESYRGTWHTFRPSRR